MRLSIHARLDYAFPEPADVLLQLEAAAMHDQRLETQSLSIWSDHPIRATTGEEGIGQRCWARGDRRLVVEYDAVVAVRRTVPALATIPATPARELPGAVIPYLLPSRYIESMRFEGFVRAQFAGLAGGALAQALTDWVAGNITYDCNASEPGGGALATFAQRRGVCRDYAHLLCALARAAEIPARCVSAYAPGVDPPDFHAVAELWLGDAWHLVDPTGMADGADLARVCVGRDATDIAFMTIFGRAILLQQQVSVTALPAGTSR